LEQQQLREPCHWRGRRFLSSVGARRTAPGDSPPSYAEKALPVVTVQIEKAGVRLAAVLNAALKWDRITHHAFAALHC
jgi:hypothetical protein